MKKETKLWLQYAYENEKSAKILLTSELHNPCLQNIQQSIEKYLKSLFVENTLDFKKTHSISELVKVLHNENIIIEINDDEIDFIDSIYLPSKYPVGSALPFFTPDDKICRKGLDILELVQQSVKKQLR